jgi:hypothetical protein
MRGRPDGLKLCAMAAASEPGVDLYWLPLGAGGHSVRLNGRVFEAVAARLDRRPPRDLYHSTLEVRMPEGGFVIEMAPVPDRNGDERGVVVEGFVGARWAGHLRIFRYEVRPGAMESSRTSTKRWRARGGCRPIRISRSACSTRCLTFRGPSGVATSSARGRCGTPTH